MSTLTERGLVPGLMSASQKTVKHFNQRPGGKKERKPGTPLSRFRLQWYQHYVLRDDPEDLYWIRPRPCQLVLTYPFRPDVLRGLLWPTTRGREVRCQPT